MAFNAKKDNVAITLNYLTLLKSSDIFFDRYSEVYVLTLAVDDSIDKKPQVAYSCTPFPKIKVGSSAAIMGDGLLLYGPRQPGNFIAISIMFMESDRDIRETGQALHDLISSKAVELGIGAVIAANPGSAAIVAIIKELALYVSGALAKNKDDELFKIEGSFLRDRPVPYHINHVYSYRNEYIGANISIIPLKEASGENNSTLSGVIEL